MADGLKTITDAVAERLKSIGIDAATGPVIETLVKRKLDKVTEAMVKLMDLIEQERRNLNKINRPDIIALNAEGKSSREEYTPGRLQEINKMKQKIEKMEKAFAKALEKNEFEDLFQAASGKLADDKGGSEPEGS